MKLILFTAACMIIATGLLLIGAHCHEAIRAAVSWPRALPRRVHARLVPDYGRHSGAVMAAGLHPCCVHCQDGSPCEPRDSHHEPCFDCPVPYVPADAQVRAHADAMHELAKPFLPPSPQGENPYPSPQEWQSYVNAGRAVEPAKADGHAPWTGEMAVLTPEAEAELDRQRYIRAQLEECRDNATREDVQAVLDSLRQPVYGQVPVAEVLESERQDAGLSA
jgi:hypothetical protein